MTEEQVLALIGRLEESEKIWKERAESGLEKSVYWYNLGHADMCRKVVAELNFILGVNAGADLKISPGIDEAES